MKKPIDMSVFSAVAVVCATGPAAATTVYLSNFNPIGAEFRDNNGTLLTAGTPAPGDGAVLQLGYYSAATTLNPFAGTWMRITGPGTGYWSTIGDSRVLDGTFSLTYHFKDTYSFVPPAGTPLAIRFYDATSLSAASHFNCVSNTDGTWNWAGGLPEPTINLTFSLTSTTQVWQGGAASAYRTTIPIPEPSACLIVMIGTLALSRRRRP